MTVYIADKFGFVEAFVLEETKYGEQVWKVKHCIDVRFAKPYKNRHEAEQDYSKTYMKDWYHCTLSTGAENDDCRNPHNKLI